MTAVIFDIETQSSFSTTIGTTEEEKKSFMQPSVVCATVLSDKELCPKSYTFWRDDNETPGGPFAPLLNLFDAADIIIGYNVISFDFPVMRKFYGKRNGVSLQRYASHIAKTLDPFTAIRDCFGPWVSLNSLLLENNLSSKISSGLKAIEMWENNKRVELEEYCMSDVDLLSQLVHLPRVHCAQAGCDLQDWMFSLEYSFEKLRLQKLGHVVRHETPSKRFKQERRSDVSCPARTVE